MEGLRMGGTVAHRTQRAPSPLFRLNRLLASPIAAVAGGLGMAPGQLSLQSLTVTVVGLLRMADRQWTHVLVGIAFVYVGLLLDRADLLIAERKGRPQPFTAFLGLAFDRLIEVALMVGLGFLALQPIAGSPFAGIQVLSDGWIFVLCAATAGLMMAVRTMATSSEVLLLRMHLLATRRLPGPSALPRHRPALGLIDPFLGRDEMVAVWCLGVALNQLELALIVLLTIHIALFVERLVLFALRLRDPELEASRILGPEYP